ncbi:MAG: NifB/NifX family molybdenum-iron cluster-binding protein [Thermodesulfobacteriota bacterium]|nr:NifB/NifX family molybdenum-iron cluster-binding protein [Thermodesulfobacteriota bacterium]
MKIVISSSGPDMDSAVDPRFGRAAYFLIVESDTGELIESIDNSVGREAAQGAGIGAAAMVAEKGVKAVLTGRVGPKAMDVIERANIRVVADASGTVRDAVERFRSGAPAGSGSAPSSQGQQMMSTGPELGGGGGMGMGGGRRGGGGGGGGRCGGGQGGGGRCRGGGGRGQGGGGGQGGGMGQRG